MTVYKQDIFWTDWTERGVFRASKNDGSGFTVLAQNLEYPPNDIHVHAESKQEICSSFCQQFNGGCSHVCVSGKSRLFDAQKGTKSHLKLCNRQQEKDSKYTRNLTSGICVTCGFQVLSALSASVLMRGTGIWQTMAKTVYKTRGNAVRQISLLVSMVTVS